VARASTHEGYGLPVADHAAGTVKITVGAAHHVHHRYTTEDVGPAVARSCHTRDLACICVLCPVELHRATSVGGLWLRRSRVRAPSVTPKASPWGRAERPQIVGLGRGFGALLMQSVMRCCTTRALAGVRTNKHVRRSSRHRSSSRSHQEGSILWLARTASGCDHRVPVDQGGASVGCARIGRFSK
jgi:hypothetical protein